MWTTCMRRMLLASFSPNVGDYVELLDEVSTFFDEMNAKIKGMGGDEILFADLFCAVMAFKKIEVKMADTMCAGRELTYNDLTIKLNKYDGLLRNEIMIFVAAKGIFERHRKKLEAKYDKAMAEEERDETLVRPIIYGDHFDELSFNRLIDSIGLEKPNGGNGEYR